MRTPGFTSVNRPQNVKKTLASMPEAAAVVDRISVGQMRSRSPPHAMIVILFSLFRPPSLRCGLIEQLRELVGRSLGHRAHAFRIT